jgi:hypothetical protein
MNYYRFLTENINYSAGKDNVVIDYIKATAFNEGE